MTRKNSFPDEVCDWLAASGFGNLLWGEREKISTIKVVADAKIVLDIVTVQISAPNVTLEELNIYFQQTQSNRTSGVKSIVIWEDYWITKRDIVKSRILAMLGKSQKIPGRLTQVRRINKELTNSFLEANHLNGAVSSRIRFGLFLPKRYYRILSEYFEYDQHTDELLVAVATFSSPRVFQSDTLPYKSYELIRFASLLHTNVVGGLDKLLHAFIEEKSPGDIMTYADLDWSDGASYTKLGFHLTGKREPETYRLEPATLKRTLAQPEHSDADETLVYNMGSLKFVKRIGY
ncbi:hypothetical protein [Dyadobacter luticola]|uniref:Uncharacterized protein n=1 Tax=Dyadobacter luticola TaxID=1979387 RepID=A0A5R9L395_9BACT|nr:hypothetical protein [Dyadobacter luticola]TLV02857.1 hypothetical protein FEN17_04380 [Dyadobacter luticola]